MDNKIKKGQISIWIILSIFLIGAIILFLFLQRKIETSVASSSLDIGSVLEECLEPSVKEAKEIMLPRGGLLKKHHTTTFNFQEVEYLCTNIGFFENCINHHPLLLREIEKELGEYLKPRLDVCFKELKRDVEKKGETILFGRDFNLEVSLVPDDIVVRAKRNIDYRAKTGEESSLKELVFEYPSGTHGLATIALEIAAQEAKYCYFESTGYSIYYPRYKIIRYQLSHPTKIYHINDTFTNEYMMIAIRSCAMTPGV